MFLKSSSVTLQAKIAGIYIHEFVLPLVSSINIKK